MTEAVLLMAYGGPNSLDDLPAYLLDVRGGRPVSPDALAIVRDRYQAIGGKSPLLEITRAQAAVLQAALRAMHGDRYRVYVGMRHWHPFITDVWAQIDADGNERVTAVCMTPQYSRVSVGAYVQKVHEAQMMLVTPLKMRIVEHWYDYPLFIAALVEQVLLALQRFPEGQRDSVHVLFSAHSVPAATVEQGDPYDRQVRQTALLVAEGAGLRDQQWQVCYQSGEGNHVRWLGPALAEVAAGLAEAGCRRLLVAPIGFACDHVETLYELDIALRRDLEARGVTMHRCAALNTSPTFIAALADIVLYAAETTTNMNV